MKYASADKFSGTLNFDIGKQANGSRQSLD